MTVSLDSWIAQADAVLARQIEDETIILEFDRAEYFGLNDTGSRIWQLLQQPAPLRSVSAQLAADFSIPASRADADVLDLVQDLVAHGLAKVVAPPPQ